MDYDQGDNGQPVLSRCPICEAGWTVCRWVDGDAKLRSTTDPGTFIPDFPNITYACGGMYYDQGNGFWGGRCWASKSQRALEFTFEEEA
jgi:hypothetical protein